MPTKKADYAELDAPTITCNNCRFTSSLEGGWEVWEGRLTFVVATDPQPRRGPDFTSCGECGAEITRVLTHWGHGQLDEEALAAIRHTAGEARDNEWTQVGAP